MSESNGDSSVTRCLPPGDSPPGPVNTDRADGSAQAHTGFPPAKGEGEAGGAAISTMREHYNLLSVREKEVLSHVAAGRLNKQIAAELGISEVMVKVHRANGMRKLHAKSVAELVRMTDLLRAQA